MRDADDCVSGQVSNALDGAPGSKMDGAHLLHPAPIPDGTHALLGRRQAESSRAEGKPTTFFVFRDSVLPYLRYSIACSRKLYSSLASYFSRASFFQLCFARHFPFLLPSQLSCSRAMKQAFTSPLFCKGFFPREISIFTQAGL